MSGCANSSPLPPAPSSLLSTELDCCVIPVCNNLKLIQTTDFFYANVDDPYTMGWITCCNVLSDLYAMGVVNCDNLLLLLGIPTDMDSTERTIVTSLIMQGFQECALKAGTSVRGGQTVYNPWVLIGGAATSVVPDTDFIMPNQAEAGSVLVLTKPLGTQLAVTAYNWLLDRSAMWTDKCQPLISEEKMRALYSAATLSMARLNRNAARLMHRHGAQACTDVTGFGVLGHARNLAAIQTAAVTFEIHRLPCLEGVYRLSKALAARHHIDTGLTPETSGGLLIVMPEKEAEEFCKELLEADGTPTWIVGRVLAAPSPVEARTAQLSPKLEIVEVPHESVVLKS
ncbi:unnamed protein product [Mesocestoides corti]|uniref:Selenide, water dikinase n=1 Tax=Mesocestoides corti TaxID=53468 RepID=A0A158QSU8_MESCO|nr:unnamed protein product [Mesocestoides corti]